MNKLYLIILSPEKEIFKGEIKSVTLPGAKGEFTILPKHSPIVSSLTKGTIYYTTADGEENSQEVGGGFVEMSDGHVSVCVEVEI